MSILMICSRLPNIIAWRDNVYHFVYRGFLGTSFTLLFHFSRRERSILISIQQRSIQYSLRIQHSKCRLIVQSVNSSKFVANRMEMSWLWVQLDALQLLWVSLRTNPSDHFTGITCIWNFDIREIWWWICNWFIIDLDTLLLGSKSISPRHLSSLDPRRKRLSTYCNKWLCPSRTSSTKLVFRV